jgi:hypothetical protein
MNCIEHDDRNAVSTCGNCGVGLCKECEDNTIFRNNNGQALCKKCNYNIACEDDCNLKALLKSKQTFMFINIGFVVIGLIFLLVRKIIGYDTQESVVEMLLIWACAAVANIFEQGSMIRRFLANIGNGVKKAIHSHSIPLFIGSIIGVVLGAVLGVFIMGIFSPIVIIAYLIGIGKVKKQIEANDAALSRLKS